ncbi:MAG: hypothetical protein C3F18_02470 [Nitrosomonadales bacterium]|nr:MAG: hypothetical protein C3F18_02470 [Nitrosomonadales bacterium]
MITVTLLGIFPLSYASQDDNDKTTAKEVRQEMADAAEAIKNYTADKRDEAAVKLRAALVALDARIEAMEARIDKNWDKMDKVAREQARNTLKALRKQRVEVAEKFGSLQNSTASAWEHMKKGFTDAYESLCSAWEKAEREYKEEDKKE